MGIDSHHHFWNYDPQEYPWITPEMGALQRDFLPPDLAEVSRESHIDGVVSVQARQSLDETRYLLGYAAVHELVRGVVGWVPLASPSLPEVLDPLAASAKLKALRHVIQDEPDEGFILREDFNRGISLLKDYSLVYDILICARQLPQAIRFVDRHPDQAFVLDHIAKPTISRSGPDGEWARKVRELARRENVVCKFSGVVTEVMNAEIEPALLAPWWETVLEAFGADRVLFGSDWPVCLLRCGYGRWVSLVRELIGELSESEQASIMGDNASRVYKLNGAAN
jgi:L-fuconolactonase